MKRILVIEDRKEVREMIAQALKVKGWQPLSASDGEQGLMMATEHLPDLVLCDVEMPKLGGFEVLERLRAHAATTAIPFIFMTGRAERPQVRQGMTLGADDYLAKPFTIRELLAAVETRLNKYDTITKLANEKLDQLRSSISLSLPHELRTPLNSILGFSSLLAQAPQTSPEEVREFADHIYTSGLRLERLVENFLLYSQLELALFQKKSFTPPPGNSLPGAHVVIGDVARKVAEKFKRDKDLIQELNPVNLAITSDYLQKIVLELVDNAFKFSDPNHAVQVRCEEKTGSVLVQIRDYGCGMDVGQMASIGPHVQFDRDVKEQQGSGLGLVLAKRLTELHGGNLRMESRPRFGTVISLDFPAASGI
ncbi:MAG: hybrid sensor histidine kinase/response regulator [Verrucomicrobiales bacterium]